MIKQVLKLFNKSKDTQLNERVIYLKDQIKTARSGVLFPHKYTSKQLLSLLDTLVEIIELSNSNPHILNINEQCDIYLMKGDSYLFLNKYSFAIEEYMRVMKISKDVGECKPHMYYYKAFKQIAWAQARNEEYKKALKTCQKLIDYAYQNNCIESKLFTIRGVCYKELGDPILAERSFKISACPHALISRVLEEEGDESFDSSFIDAGLNNSLGTSYFEQQMFEKAIEYYDKAIALNSSYAIAYYNKGVALSECNLFNDAIYQYSNCIALGPSEHYAIAIYNRGIAYFNIKERELSKKDLLHAANLGVSMAEQVLQEHF